MRRILITAAVAVAAAVALPQVAQGATLHQDGKHRVLLQDTGGDANLVTVEGSHRVLIEDINVPIEVDGGHGRDRFNAGMTDGPSQVRWSGGIGLDTISYAHAETGVDVAVDPPPP